MLQKLMSSLLSNEKILFWIFVILALLIYAPTWQAGYSSDYFGYLDAYKTNEWKDILLAFHYGSLLYILHYVTYFFVHFFGPENIFLYLVAAGFHGINCFLTYKFGKKLLKLSNISEDYIALGAAVLFLINPYLTEGLTWKACLHYPMVVTFILLALNYYCDFLDQNKPKLRWLAILFFVLSCFTLEFGMFVPGIFAFLLFIKAYNTRSISLVKKEILYTWLTCAAFLGIYLLLNKIILGVYIGHYKAESHLAFGVHSLVYIIKAFIKTLFFARHWPHLVKMPFFETFLVNPVNALACMLFLLGIIFVILQRNRQKLILAAFLIAGFGLFFLPVCNSYFVMLSWFEVDRYVFVSLVFFLLLFMLVLSMLKKPVRIALFSIFFIISAYFLSVQILMVYDSGISSQKIMDSGAKQYESSKKFILLNVPDSYNGFWMYTNFSDDVPALTEGLNRLKDCDQEIRKNKRLLAYVMLSSNDSFNITRIEPNKWKMSMGQWGSWWIKNGVGTTGFENDSMKVEIQMIDAIITLKRPMNEIDFWLMNKSQLSKVEGMKYEAALMNNEK